MVTVKKRLPDRLWLLLLVIACLPAVWPLLHNGFFHFSDEPHIANLFQMVRALESGQIPPRLAPDMSYEYGYPLFNFYYPLPFYLGSLFFVFTQSLIISLKLVFLFSVIASAYFMYLFLKEHTDNLKAFIGSLIYVYTPYRAVDLYVRGALGEALAFAFIPLIFLGITKVIKVERPKLWVLFLGLSVTVFMLSHNLAPLMFLPLSYLYALIYAFPKRRLKRVWWVIAGYILGLGMSTFWWLPAFIEKGLVRSNTPFNYFDHFPFIKQLIYSPFSYGASNPGLGDDISFQIGVVNIILIFLGIFFVIKNKTKSNLYLISFLIFGIIISLFLMNIRSSFLWELFSLSNYIQFPWRLLMLTTFLTPLFVIFIPGDQVKSKLLLISLGIGSLLLTFNYFKPSGYFYPDDNYFLNRFFARNPPGDSGKVSDYYHGYSEDYLLLPNWTAERPEKLSENVFTGVGKIAITEVTVKNAVSYSAEFMSEDNESYITIAKYFFPGWYITIDGQHVKPVIAKAYGNMLVNVPQGKHTINVFWKESGFRLFADIISALSMAGMSYFYLKWRKNEKT